MDLIPVPSSRYPISAWDRDHVEWEQWLVLDDSSEASVAHETGGRSQLAAAAAVGEADLPPAGAEGGHDVARWQKDEEEIAG